VAALAVVVGARVTETVDDYGGGVGSKILAATASVMGTQFTPGPNRHKRSRAAESFAGSSNPYVRVFRVAGFASSRRAADSGMKNSPASGITVWSRSYAVPWFATSSKPILALCPYAEIVRRAFTYDANP